MLIIRFHIYSVGRIIHSLMYVVYLDLLYWLSIIFHRTGIVALQTQYIHIQHIHLHGVENRRVTPRYTLLQQNDVTS